MHKYFDCTLAFIILSNQELTSKQIYFCSIHELSTETTNPCPVSSFCFSLLQSFILFILRHFSHVCLSEALGLSLITIASGLSLPPQPCVGGSTHSKVDLTLTLCCDWTPVTAPVCLNGYRKANEEGGQSTVGGTKSSKWVVVVRRRRVSWVRNKGN